ncbi:disulfide bond formation protein B [Acidithiobacillus concretivorus]|uniref:Disulfide bond formation protein B n=1 Tax=Acidithiobacillus concretivorus TaxID=3063952 RepID=A0ABS5ZQ51_9PROT|nr:disulfide bond formation protein B [Acidithiobacillus concretivorus]MBU2738585.1 disulfide bond formation protein B [Acidithiobacillus concretivorus]
MNTRNLAGSATSLGSTLAAVFSASAGACAGGVCLAGAQAGISAFSASSTSFAAMAAASSAAEGVSASGVDTVFPWWMKLAIVALMLSTIYTTAILFSHRKWAVFAALGGVFAVIAELHWLPVGKRGELLAIAIGVTPLVLGPLLLRWERFFSRDRIQNGIRIASGILAGIAFIWVFYLQISQGWEPCALCWIERIALAGVIYAAFAGRPDVAFVSSILGIGAVFLQLAEIHHAAHALTGFCSLFSHTSCAVAGSQSLGPWPIALDAGVLFAVLLMLSMAAWPQRHEKSGREG